MITLTVYHPTKEFMKFLDENKFKYTVETISSCPNREGKCEPGIVLHVENYLGNLFEGIIGFRCKWHSIPMRWPLPSC